MRLLSIDADIRPRTAVVPRHLRNNSSALAESVYASDHSLSIAAMRPIIIATDSVFLSMSSSQARHRRSVAESVPCCGA
jgi:hypothetical protein